MRKYDSSEKLDWIDFDPETLTPELQGTLSAIHETMDTLRGLEQDFKAGFLAQAKAEGVAPKAGEEFQYGFKYKKLVIAYAPIKVSKAKKPGMGFGKKTAKPAVRSMRAALKK